MKPPRIMVAFFLIAALILPFFTQVNAQPGPSEVPQDSPSAQVHKSANNISTIVADKVYAIYQPPDNHVKILISAIGDCTLGQDESFGNNGTFNSEFKKQKGNFKYFFSGVKQRLASDDLTIANLETTLTTATVKAQKKFRFKGMPEYVNILKEGSIETVNVANNHSHDYLQKGFNETVTNVNNAGIKCFGFGYSSIVVIKGIRVGLLGYTVGTSSKKQIRKDLDNMKKNADIIIVSFHWGAEGAKYPNAQQKDLGHYAIDLGASLVLGHHPHVVEGIENYKGKNIVYSLANFCFGGNRNPSDKDTFIYQQTFEFDQNHKLISLEEKTLIPCSISSVKNRNDYHPVILTGTEKTRVLNRINSLTPGK